MRHAEYAAFDAMGLAALVARGEVSAAELLDAAVRRLDEVGGTINPIAVRMIDIARARVRERLSGPFAGVPFLLKDWHQDYEGQPSTGGCRGRVRWVSEAHSTYTQRCLDAGLVVFGRTTTPEFSLMATTESALYGATRNPWAPARTPGGSSGGSAAAVASEIVPMAGASDGGGSIRIPAGYCGLFGFRPGRGVVPEGPEAAEGWEGANSNFVLTRSVRDAVSMLTVLAGSDEGAPFALAQAPAGGTGACTRLRVGFDTRSALGAVHPAAIDAVHDAARLLEGLGHEVEEAAPAVDGAEVARCFFDLYLGQVPAHVAAARARTGSGPDEFEPVTRSLVRLGGAMSAGEYVTSHRQWNAFGRALGRFFSRFDLFMLPTAAGPPPLIGELAPSWTDHLMMRALDMPGGARMARRLGVLEGFARTSLSRTPFTQLSNLTGTPSMSVPLHWAPPAAGEPDVPFGVQFVGPVGGEARLLGLAAELEMARPWAGRRPVPSR